MRRLGLLVLFISATATAQEAGAPPAPRPIPGIETPEVVPTDAKLILDQLRRAYRDSVRAEQVDVTVDDGLSRKTETLVVRTWPGQKFELELGSVRVWSEGTVIRAIHTANAGVYFERAIGDKVVLDVLGELLPPIPAPQLDLALGSASETDSLMGYVKKIHWETGEITDARTVRLSARGRAEDASVNVQAVGDPPRLSNVAIELDDGRVKLTCVIAPTGESAKEAPGVDVSGRRVVNALTELTPKSP